MPTLQAFAGAERIRRRGPDRNKRSGHPYQGTSSSQVKLNAAKVIEIRTTYKYGHLEFGSHALAKKYGVSHTIILRVVQNKAWIHIP